MIGCDADSGSYKGIPLHPTLGSPTRSLDEIYERLGDLSFSAEFKYDGQRAQIHAERGEDRKVSTWIFSRHLEDMTTKVNCYVPVRPGKDSPPISPVPGRGTPRGGTPTAFTFNQLVHFGR